MVNLTYPNSAQKEGIFMELTEQFILLQAPNAAAAANGRKLSSGGKFSNLRRTESGDLFWGECAGSGKTPYRVSIDWTDPNAPVSRCSCPSRQFPCKHALGLMFEQLAQKRSPRTSRKKGRSRPSGPPKRKPLPPSPRSPMPPLSPSG